MFYITYILNFIRIRPVEPALWASEYCAFNFNHPVLGWTATCPDSMQSTAYFLLAFNFSKTYDISNILSARKEKKTKIKNKTPFWIQKVFELNVAFFCDQKLNHSFQMFFLLNFSNLHFKCLLTNLRIRTNSGYFFWIAK